MTTEDLIAYYQQLLITQYVLLPNALGTIDAYVSQVIQNQIELQVQDGFNFAVSPIGLQTDSAAGVQLDVVASYVGAQRVIYGLSFDRTFFSMPRYGEADADTFPGFALYGQSPISDLWLTYEDANLPIYALTDDQLYRFSQFLAQENSLFESVANVDDLLFDFFGLNVAVFEVSPMAITFIDLISDPDPLFGIVAASGHLPRPAGVAATVIRSETIDFFFGFQIYGSSLDPDFVGFGLYGSPQAGSFVRYA